MRLPQLRVLKEELRSPISCQQHDYCGECSLYVKNGGRCEGCTKTHRAELSEEFQWCYQECHSCTGYKATVTAVCCRSPLKKMYLDAVTRNADDWNKPKFSYTKRELLSFPNKAIFLFGQKCNAKLIVEDALENLKVIATNMKVVVKPSGKGFVSNDLHDFLSLNKRTKIILTTMDIDEQLEKSWTEEFYDQPELYEKVGVSYWMPLAFSVYGDSDARMHQFYQFCRTNVATERSRAHFIPGYYLGRGLRLDDLILEALQHVPQVMFNAQFLGSATSDNFKTTLKSILRWHNFAPAHVAFWIVGASTPAFFHNVRKIVGNRDIYYVSGKPLYMALYGQRMKTDGNERDLEAHEHPSKPDLIRDNYRMFRQLVEKWDKGVSNGVSSLNSKRADGE